jgi:hypothetical protein
MTAGAPRPLHHGAGAAGRHGGRGAGQHRAREGRPERQTETTRNGPRCSNRGAGRTGVWIAAQVEDMAAAST